jgi:hypothetical protein
MPTNSRNAPLEIELLSPSNVAEAPLPEGLAPVINHQIRQRAYELWLARGCREGDDLQNWIDAEREIVFSQLDQAA